VCAVRMGTGLATSVLARQWADDTNFDLVDVGGDVIFGSRFHIITSDGE